MDVSIAIPLELQVSVRRDDIYERGVINIGRRVYDASTNSEDNVRVNESIHWRGDIRLIAEDGEQLGLMDVQSALRVAESRGLDLVEVSPDARPPVCKIMNYGKFKFDRQKKERASKAQQRKANKNDVKEMKFRLRIGDGDFDTKMNHIKRFLADGNKVRVTIMFRGREVTHAELGADLFDRIVAGLDGIADPVGTPAMAGRDMSLIFVPTANAAEIIAAQKAQAKTK